MATDFKVVIPDDMGTSIVLGAKVAGKYDVDVSQLDLPAGIDRFELTGTTLTAKTNKGDKTIDLAPILPTIAADVFLKDVKRVNNEIVFTVGEQGSTTSDTEFKVDISDLLPSVTDGVTITGTGATASPLKVQVSTTTTDNLLKQGTDGLYVSAADIPTGSTDPRDVRLVNATGTTVVGYVYSSET